jgi:transposase-like protein
MTKSYYARLRLVVSVPENPIIEPLFKGCVEYEILCPKCGLEHKQLKKNGFDTNHGENPQLFRCTRCQLSFYAHTSWLFHQLSATLLERIVTDLFEERLPPKAVATIHQVSPSLISAIRLQFRETLEYILARVSQKRLQLQAIPQLPIPLDQVIYWDETFFCFGTTSWGLILLINARGEPLVWKFSRTRKVADYLELVTSIRDQLPPVIIFVGDAWPAYQQTCEQLQEECFLIEHVHSHPWDKVRLHHFLPEAGRPEIRQISLEMPYDGFVRNLPVEGSTFARVRKVKTPTTLKRNVGRPKGSRDHQPRRTRNHTKPTTRKKAQKPRGRTRLTTQGRGVCFHPHPFANGWQVEWVSPPLTNPALQNPTVAEVELLLDVTYKIMRGGYIQSNRIESLNREIKAVVSDRGLKSALQTSQIIEAHLRYWGNHLPNPNPKKVLVSPISPGLAFTHLMEFFHPIRDSYQITTAILEGDF